ncbi:tellurite resistance TerB family protein [Vulgatibacter sp.]|uniref:tellurite resistance TerB family protein n=1 Tax=Vulgatibacter sp. TaxID=1971226 RepID=UPI003565FFD5
MDKAISWARAHLSGDANGAASELCLAAMVAGASGDGIDAAERAYVIDTASKLPGFDQMPTDQLQALFDRVVAALDGADLKSTLQKLSEGANAEQRRAAYSLACLAALSDGAATDEELDLLLEIRDGVGLTDGEAADVEATIREGVGAREVFEEDGVAWRLATPEVQMKAALFAQEALDPTPLAPYAGACVEAMVLAAAADGGLSAAEADHIHELAERLPVLGGIDGHELERFVADAAGRIAREGAERRLEALAGWLPEEARRSAFILAMVVALADHRATRAEMHFLERMRETFGIGAAEGEELLAAVRDQVYG